MSSDRGVLLDTSAIIDFDAAAIAGSASSASVSTVTLAELSAGLYTADPLENADREAHYHWVVNTFEPIAYDDRAARIYGVTCALVRRAGRRVRPRRFDLLIASVAIASDLPLATRNPDDFRGLGDALHVIAVR